LALRDHRPFLRAFLRAVHDVTGKLYGPDIYRRLLHAYARAATRRHLPSPANATRSSGRSPSPAAVPAQTLSPAVPPDTFAMRALFDEYLPHFGRVAAQAGRDFQVDYLQAGCARPSARRPTPGRTPFGSPASWTPAKRRWRSSRRSSAT
jgi:hypothetical protein